MWKLCLPTLVSEKASWCEDGCLGTPKQGLGRTRDIEINLYFCGIRKFKHDAIPIMASSLIARMFFAFSITQYLQDTLSYKATHPQIVVGSPSSTPKKNSAFKPTTKDRILCSSQVLKVLNAIHDELLFPRDGRLGIQISCTPPAPYVMPNNSFGYFGWLLGKDHGTLDNRDCGMMGNESLYSLHQTPFLFLLKECSFSKSTNEEHGFALLTTVGFVVSRVCYMCFLVLSTTGVNIVPFITLELRERYSLFFQLNLFPSIAFRIAGLRS
ncbi:hypothetical protein OS493_032633 [Desmophyllum pertusum]|uniref:Uncharacterized protein n=1 Tax=Desmophyllum pertusum TaxID=174260 RepID=A0A9X0CHV2_9CNID|nr:hypothetical protein OS493_032633 [Desmophyllum pertusum]